MTTRNRGNYSGYGKRRSGSMNLLRQGIVFVSLGALSFLLGFFVLARLAPISHGPDTPGSNAVAPPVSVHDHAEHPPMSARRVSTERAATSAPDPAVTQPSTSAPPVAAVPAGPSIDPADDSKTQAPTSLDDGRSASPSGAVAAGASPDTSGVKAADAATLTPALPTHRRRRHTHHRGTHTVAPTTSAPATEVQKPASMDDGTQPAGQPDAPAKDGGNSQGDNGAQ